MQVPEERKKITVNAHLLDVSNQPVAPRSGSQVDLQHVNTDWLDINTSCEQEYLVQEKTHPYGASHKNNQLQLAGQISAVL